MSNVETYDPSTGITTQDEEENEGRDPLFDVMASSLIPFAMAVQDNYNPGLHHHIIAKELMKVIRGETKRLMIFAPPQTGKSRLSTEIFPAFFYGHFPELSLIVAGYGQDKADDFGRATKGFMALPIYRQIFPETKISPKADSIRHFETTKGGTYYCVGIGGPVTGRGANGLIFDDPYKNRAEADSETRTEVIKDWYTSSFRSRLRGDGFIIIIQTRWTKRDLIEYLLEKQEASDEKYHWRIVNLRQQIEDEQDAKEDVLKRKVGEVLWPEVYPKDVVEQLKIDSGPRDWNALHQQRPSDAQGELFLRKNWNYWCRKNCNAEHAHHPLPDKIDSKMQMWDCTFKDLKTSDFVVGGIGYKAGPNLYLMDLVRKRVTCKGTCDLIRTWLIKWPDVHKIGVEDKANGPEVISVMKQEVSGVVEVPANGSKDSRASACSVHQESGNIYLPYDAVWKDDFIEECAAYPHGKYDDQVDMISHMTIQMLGNRLSAMLDWMKEQVEKLKNRNAA